MCIRDSAHAALAADILDLPMGYVRGGAKSHGRNNRIEGVVKEGMKVVVVEDLISTGGSSLECVEALREAGCEVLGLIAIFTYGLDKATVNFENAHCPFVTLSNYDTLIEVAKEHDYIKHEDMEKLKNTVVESVAQELARRLFLFSYYCYGISFIDAALLTKKNIIRYNGGNYIVYKRNKTKEAKRVKPIQIRITQEIQDLLDWFATNTLLVEDYLLPIVSIAGYKGEQLYNHIRSRFGRNNKNLANLAQTLGITDMKLTSYVSRHTMAMTLQDNQVPREVISQILGHSDLATTNTYLDSFGSSVIDEAVKVL